jgi:outer membrane protein
MKNPKPAALALLALRAGLLHPRQVAQAEAQVARAVAQARLNLTIGLPYQEVFEPVVQFSSEADELPSLETLLAQALRDRPETSAAQGRLRLGRAALALARSGWFPTLYAVAEYRYAMPNPRQFPPAAEFVGTWDVGIAGTIDVGRWPAVANRTSQAQSRLAQTEQARAQVEETITLEVIQSSLEVSKSRQAIAVAAQLIEQAEESYRIIDEKFRNGLALSSALLDAGLVCLEAELRLSEARSDHELARAALRLALGSEPSPGLPAIRTSADTPGR